jgi:hypothetical protein
VHRFNMRSWISEDRVINAVASIFKYFSIIYLDDYHKLNEMESERRKVGFQVHMKTIYSLQFLFSDKLEAWLTVNCEFVRRFLGNLKRCISFIG